MNELIIDATDKSLGRVATQIALYLQGKASPNYNPASTKNHPKVKVIHLGKIKIVENKLSKIYRWHTGYIGHLRERSFKDLWREKPIFLVRHAVLGMLPKNKLRARRMRNLTVEL